MAIPPHHQCCGRPNTALPGAFLRANCHSYPVWSHLHRGACLIWKEVWLDSLPELERCGHGAAWNLMDEPRNEHIEGSVVGQSA